MWPTYADRVQETTGTSGTGPVTLNGAVSQAQSFAAGIGVGRTTDYALLSGNGVDWETGIGTVGGTGPYTLSRTTILASSNAGMAINLTGVSTVYGTLTAFRLNNPAIYAPVVTGETPGPVLVADSSGQCIMTRVS